MNSDPYGAVLWPAAFSVATYLLTSIRKNDNIHAKNDRKPFKSVSDVLKGLSILELGTGTGLVSLAAALGGASKIIATDYEEVPLRLLDFAANGPLNSEYAIDTEEEKNDRIDRLSNIKTCKFMLSI